MLVRDLPTNTYTSPLLGSSPTFWTCLHIPFTPIRISVGCCAITIRLSSFELNITVFLRDKGKQYQRNGKNGLLRMVTDGNIHLLLCPNMTHIPTKKASVTVVTKALREKGRLPTLPHCIAVPSAQVGLTSLFGMGRGGTPPQ